MDNILNNPANDLPQSGPDENLIGQGVRKDIIFDVGTQDFEERVMKASMETPIIVDFWAPWCGPCKQLTPMLEDEVRKADGKVLLAKVNMDDNQELAQALQIQSIPTIYAFFKGQPVTGFSGAKPQSEIASLIRQLSQMAGQAGPENVDIDAYLAQAVQALSEKDFQQAGGLYSAILQHERFNAKAYCGLIRTHIAAGQVENAKQLVDNVPAEIESEAAFAEVKTALDLALNAENSGNIDELQAAVDKKPEDKQARFDLANALFHAGQQEESIDHLVTIISQDREWDDSKAKDQLLKFFEALGPQDPIAVSGRRKLSSVLFS